MKQEETPPGPSYLERLPSEIQVEIVSNLSSPADQSSIQALLRTCKWLYHIVLPFSVRTFRNTPPQQGKGLCSERRNAQFLRYILITKPDLAPLVHTLILGPFSSNHAMGYDGPAEDEDHKAQEDDASPFAIHSAKELILYKDKIINFYNPDTAQNYSREWIKDLELGTSDAQIALILISCPNLRHIFFETPYLQRHFSDIVQLASDPKTILRPGLGPPLSRLQCVYTEGHEASADVDDSADVAIDRNPLPFFKLKGLHSFEGVNISCGDDLSRWLSELPSGTSSIEDIILRKSYISPRMLQAMLTACKAVKQLEFTRGHYDSPFTELLPRDVLVAILPHAASLESLYLNIIEERLPPLVPDGDHLLYMGTDLRQMTSLKKLVTGMRSLNGMFDGYTFLEDGHGARTPLRVSGAPKLVDCLPENLEYLEIHRCGKVILGEAQELILAVQEGRTCTKLKHIRLLFNRESVSPDKIRLSYNSSVIHVELIFQSFSNRAYDFIPSYVGGHGRVENICSPIYAQALREQWLTIRGKDLGFASDEFELYEAPGVWVSQNKPNQPRPSDYLANVLKAQEDVRQDAMENNPDLAALILEYEGIARLQNQNQ